MSNLKWFWAFLDTLDADGQVLMVEFNRKAEQAGFEKVSDLPTHKQVVEHLNGGSHDKD